MRVRFDLPNDRFNFLLRYSPQAKNTRSAVFKANYRRLHADIAGATVQDIRNFIAKLFFD